MEILANYIDCCFPDKISLFSARSDSGDCEYLICMFRNIYICFG